jgi:site-specific DNA-methyltransferase (adenine-specific)
MTPYWQDDRLTLYHGDAMELLPMLKADAIITDPPYNETSLDWDRWPDGWPAVASGAAASMWCFGSLRMFMERTSEFASWKLSQDVIWEKHNGTNPFNDRFRRVHEVAAHFYRGDWAEVYKSPQFTNDATARTVRRKARPPQWGDIGAASYASDDGGPRLAGSVIYARSCHGTAIHPTQKPEAIIAPLMEYSVPAGGLVLDCFAGSGVVLLAARKTGRRAIGIEKGEERCAAIVERLSQVEMALGESCI